MRGPFSLSINDEMGLLVDGFDRPPSVMMGHARPYYAERVAEAMRSLLKVAAAHVPADRSAEARNRGRSRMRGLAARFPSRQL